MPKSALIILAADEKKYTNEAGKSFTGRLGERNYTRALEAEKRLRSGQDTFIVKTSLDPAQLYLDNTPSLLQKNPFLPDNEAYAALPYYTPDLLQQIAAQGDYDTLTITGSGNSTLAAAKDLMDKARNQNRRIEAGYVTHMVNSRDDLQMIADNKIKVFTSLTSLDRLGADLASQVDLVTLDAEPYVDDDVLDTAHYHIFMATENGQKLQDVLEKGIPVACAVVNAGFPINGEHVPYTAEEARLHGYAFGFKMAEYYLNQPVALLVTDGGTRNSTDEGMGHQTLEAFAAGYEQAQKERPHGQAIIIKDRYKDKLPYNLINVIYKLDEFHPGGCRAISTNAESRETMSKARRKVDNARVHLCAYPFNALYLDPTGLREESLISELHKGITLYRNIEKMGRLFSVNTSSVVLMQTNGLNATPFAPLEDPAKQILDSFAFVPKRNAIYTGLAA